MPNNSKQIYKIKQVSDITGLSKQLIRKWEERYQIVEPERMDNGYRVYGDKDVQNLMNIKKLVDEGYSIKNAINMMNDLELSHQAPTLSPSTTKNSKLNKYILNLLEQGKKCNEKGIHQVLQQANHENSLLFFLYDVVKPFLIEVGRRWEIGEWGEYQEALVSIVIRDYLVQIRRNFFSNGDNGLILGACFPHERHEIPIHFILLQGLLNGYQAVFFGPSPARGTIESAINQLKPQKVVLSVSTQIPFKKEPTILDQLNSLAHKLPDTKFYVGGASLSEAMLDKENWPSLIITNEVNDVFTS